MSYINRNIIFTIHNSNYLKISKKRFIMENDIGVLNRQSVCIIFKFYSNSKYFRTKDIMLHIFTSQLVAVYSCTYDGE